MILLFGNLPLSTSKRGILVQLQPSEDFSILHPPPRSKRSRPGPWMVLSPHPPSTGRLLPVFGWPCCLHWNLGSSLAADSTTYSIIPRFLPLFPLSSPRFCRPHLRLRRLILLRPTATRLRSFELGFLVYTRSSSHRSFDPTSMLLPRRPLRPNRRHEPRLQPHQDLTPRLKLLERLQSSSPRSTKLSRPSSWMIWTLSRRMSSQRSPKKTSSPRPRYLSFSAAIRPAGCPLAHARRPLNPRMRLSFRASWSLFKFSLRPSTARQASFPFPSVSRCQSDLRKGRFLLCCCDLFNSLTNQTVPNSCVLLLTLFRTQATIRHWLISQLSDPKIGPKKRQERFEVLLAALDVCQTRSLDDETNWVSTTSPLPTTTTKPLNASSSTTVFELEPVVTSFVASAIAAALVSPESRLFVHTWHAIAQKRSLQSVDSLVQLVSRSTPSIGGEPHQGCSASLGWILERLVEVVCVVPNHVESSASGNELVNFDKRR